MPKNTTEAEPETALALQQTETALGKINAYLAAQPTVEEDPTEAMLAAVLGAAGPDEWSRIFESRSLRDNAGARVRINAYRVMPSDFEGGLTHYLVLDVTYLKSGERGVISASSQMSIAQILNAEARGGFPIDVEIVEKDKPTRRGFKPIHLRFVGRPGAPIGDPASVVSEQ